MITGKGRSVWIELDQLLSDPIDAPQGLVDSMNSFGQQVPILVREEGDGYRVLDGRRRVQAAKELHWDHIEAIIAKADENPSVVSILGNMQRSDNPMIEAESLEALLSDGWGEDRIAKELGLSRPRIRQRMKLLGLNPQLRKKLLVGQMTIGSALEAVKLGSEVQAELGQAEGRVTQQEVGLRVRQRQEALLDLESITAVPQIGVGDSAAWYLRSVASKMGGQKRQTLLEAAEIIEQEVRIDGIGEKGASEVSVD